MGLVEIINYYYYDLCDSRIRGLFFMNSIWYPIIVILIYLVVVFKLAPDYMKKRPAYKLNTYIKCYNLFQVVGNAYLVKELSKCYPFHRALECRPTIYSTDYCGMMIVKCAYIGMWLKLIDLTETMVYIFRKKNNQVSFLHLYHHLTTYLLGVLAPRYFSVETVVLIPILNCSVHVIMYSYYFLSNFEGPIKQIIIPFKRYLTLIQMGQFTIIIVQLSAFLAQECDLPKQLVIVMMLNVFINFWLFFRFYKQTYIDAEKKTIEKRT